MKCLCLIRPCGYPAFLWNPACPVHAPTQVTYEDVAAKRLCEAVYPLVTKQLDCQMMRKVIAIQEALLNEPLEPTPDDR